MEPNEIAALPAVLELDWQQFYAQQGMTRPMLEGLHHEQFAARWDIFRDVLWARFTAAVLAEDAGPEVIDTVRWLSPLRPRWIPKWLWRRIPTREVKYQLRVQPRYIYPHATVKVAALGSPVRFPYQTATNYYTPDWRQENDDE